MATMIPFVTLFIALVLGIIITINLSIKLRETEKVFFAVVIGVIIFTVVNFLNCLLFGFPNGFFIATGLIFLLETVYILKNYKNIIIFFKNFILFKNEKYLLILLLSFGLILFLLFNTHILLNINGDLYTGESTYGDLPFHLSTISEISFRHKLPPENPLYAGEPMVYPYLINFFSAILVYQGWSLRASIVIPGMILSLALIGLVYEFTFELLKDRVKSFFTTALYFLNGGTGFYFFLKDQRFDINNIFQTLMHPSNMKEYSHLFEQNIQWVNFLSRIIVPERSVLFGIPAGIIILRMLFFGTNMKHLKLLEILVISILLAMMPLLHTHTVLSFVIILPIITIFKVEWSKKFFANIFILLLLTFLLSLVNIPQFINHVQSSQGFAKFHIGWMQKPGESLLEFWFKNTYLLIPFSVAIFLTKAPKSIKILQFSGMILFILINLILFSPYDWDNVKFLFWAGLFFDISIGFLLGEALKRKGFLLKILVLAVVFTMTGSAVLSILREVNVKYILFTKDAATMGDQIKNLTPVNSIFLTYKIHNSPVNNLAGRSILMGYPGLLWVHGINYQQRESDIDQIFAGSQDTAKLISKYQVKYIVLEDYNPDRLYINREYFTKYPIFLKNSYYTIYQLQ